MTTTTRNGKCLSHKNKNQLRATPTGSLLHKLTKTNICTSVPDAAEVLADPHKLSGRHADDGLVLGIRDAEVLTIDVHQLHLEIDDFILLCPFPKQNNHNQG
jgi:hypothetical protein